MYLSSQHSREYAASSLFQRSFLLFSIYFYSYFLSHLTSTMNSKLLIRLHCFILLSILMNTTLNFIDEWYVQWKTINDERKMIITRYIRVKRPLNGDNSLIYMERSPHIIKKVNDRRNGINFCKEFNSIRVCVKCCMIKRIWHYEV